MVPNSTYKYHILPENILRDSQRFRSITRFDIAQQSRESETQRHRRKVLVLARQEKTVFCGLFDCLRAPTVSSHYKNAHQFRIFSWFTVVRHTNECDTWRSCRCGWPMLWKREVRLHVRHLALLLQLVGHTITKIFLRCAHDTSYMDWQRLERQ